MSPAAALLLAALALESGGVPARSAVEALRRADGSELAGTKVTSVSVVVPREARTVELERFLEIRKGDRFSARQVRRTIEVLAKLGDFAEIGVEARRNTEGVDLTIRLVPVPRVRRITVKGFTPASRVTAALGVSAGDPVPSETELERMAVDARDALIREGWRRAAVEVEAATNAAGEALVNVRVEPGVRSHIRSISFEGDMAYDEAELLRRSGLKVGNPLTDRALNAARSRILELHRSDDFLEARLPLDPPRMAQTDSAGNARVVVLVSSGERIDLQFDKRPLAERDRLTDPLWWYHFRDDRLKSYLDLASESQFTEGFGEEASERLAARYRRRGYLEASVAATYEVQPSKRRKSFRFKIDPGRRFKLRSVELVGEVESLPSDVVRGLRNELPVGLPGMAAGHFLPEEVDGAVAHLVDYLRSLGYAEARIEAREPRVDRARRKVDLELAVEPGPRLVVGKIEIAGNQQASADALRTALAQPAVGIRTGQPLNAVSLERVGQAVESYYASIGLPYARAESSTVTVKGVVDLSIRVDEGLQAFVGRVIVKGNEFTRRDVIDRILPVRTGLPYTPALIASGGRALTNLGTFSRVSIAPFEDEEPERVRDIRVGVSEANRKLLEPSIGASNQDGPRLGLRAVHRNLFGSAKSISLRWQANWRWDGILADSKLNRLEPAVDYSKIEQRMLLTYAQPLTFRRPVTTSMTASLFEKEESRSFGYSGNRVIVAADRGIDVSTGPLREASVKLIGRYQMFLRDVEYEDRSRQEAVAVEPADFPLDPSASMYYWPFRWKIASLSAGTFVDRRDDRVNPTDGYTFTLNADLAARAFGSDVSFGRVTGSLSWFRPGPGGLNVAATARGGYAVPLFASRGIPVDQRFHLGGTGSVRGFAESSIGPRFASGSDFSTGGNLAGSYNLELRHRLALGLDGVIFHDAGTTVLLDRSPIRPDRGTLENPDSLSTGVGVGLRIPRTPIGPIKFDFGVDTDKLEELRALPGWKNVLIHFTIGDF